MFRGLRTLVEEAVVYHVTGKNDMSEAAGFCEALGEGLLPRYHVAAFREDLPTLLVAADVAVMRAGASVLGEIPAAGVAAILVPGRYAGGHQRNNAAWLADGGAAIVLDESEVGRLRGGRDRGCWTIRSGWRRCGRRHERWRGQTPPKRSRGS